MYKNNYLYPNNIFFAFPQYFSFTSSHQNSCLGILLSCNSGKPINTLNFPQGFIYIAHGFSVEHFAILKFSSDT